MINKINEKNVSRGKGVNKFHFFKKRPHEQITLFLNLTNVKSQKSHNVKSINAISFIINIIKVNQPYLLYAVDNLSPLFFDNKIKLLSD